MQDELVLVFRDKEGALQNVPVTSRRFTIGSETDSHLVIEDDRVSGRHALIENVGGRLYVSDCNSERGTLLNDVPLRRMERLRPGDLLTLGGTYNINVTLRDAPQASRASSSAPTPPARRPTQAGEPKPAPSPRRVMNRRPPPAAPGTAPPVNKRRTGFGVVAAAVAGVVLGGSAFLLLNRQPAPAPSQTRDGGARQTDFTLQDDNTDAARDMDALGGGVKPDDGSAVKTTQSDEELERELRRVMWRLSPDGRPADFTDDALRDIGRQVEAYRGSSRLRDNLAAMQRAARPIAAEARREGIEPGLVIYAALAESDGGRDPAAVARAMIPQLHLLRVTFGSDADSSLIVLAAYTHGVGTKKWHPLLDTIRRLVKNSYAERNVWYLRERGGLKDAAYGLVVRTLAVGVIAREPKRYGVQAEPLSY